ncbi:MAG: RNA polymerase sigma factor [Candidatus Geothermincolia bacterium]
MPNKRLSRDGREDARLVRECRDGDERAFEALVLKYQDQVFGVAYRMVSDREEAMDVAQETFIKAFQGLDSFDARMPFRAWLLRIGTNSSIDHLRRRNRSREVRTDGQYPVGDWSAGPANATLAFDPPGPDTDIPENISMSNETAGVVRTALDGLPEKYKAVMVLHHMEGMSYSEIGKVMGVPRNTAKTWGHRARGLLCEALEGVM